MNTRGMFRVLGAATAVAGLMAVASVVHADVKCRAALTKESSKTTQAIVKILQKCEQGVLAGKVVGPCPDSKSAGSIQKLKDKIGAVVAKSCPTSTGEFTFGRCPNANGGTGAAPCTSILIQSKADVAECLGCLAEENGSELVSGVMYGSAIAPADKDIGKCQATVGKSVAAFYITKSKLLAGCQAALLKGKATSCPDTKTADGIVAAEVKKVASITKACCGDDGACGGGVCTAGGGDSGDACEANRDCNRCTAGASIGSPCFVTPECPNYTAPAATCVASVCNAGPKVGLACTVNADCNQSGACSTNGLCESDDYRPIQDLGFPVPCPGVQAGGSPVIFTGQTMQSVLTCLDTHAAVRAECQDAAGAPFSYTGSLPSGCTAPVPTCSPNAGTATATVSFTGPASIGGVSVSLGYTGVTLPGTGGTPTGRVTNLQSGLLEEGDRDDSINVSITDLGGLVPGALFSVQFDTCGAAPTPSSFGCVVRSASDINGIALLDGVSCLVSVP